ncbi:hypothetical protein A2839_00750 [Candidatus Uhrbacteria bacterium RIFCSPHIGHO2_01_FULL_47_10]|nr:MAG: hypothetical protein A2839_00750 [Candidatus Uhrbacteria bacterium RIFCSPHIGHO2_01_FULL_47_10]
MILTVDILVTIAQKDVLLIRRAKHPFEDRLVMPGGHVEDGEELCEAAARELEEETRLTVSSKDLSPLLILDAIDRDPRPGRRVSHVFWIDLLDRTLVETCRAESDAREIVIRSIDSLVESEIGFDHWLALEKMKEEIAHESARVS